MDIKIQKIIEKIRLMAKYNPNIRSLVAEQKASIRLKEDEDGNIVLYCIEFSYYDVLYVYENKMVFQDDGGKKTTLFEYANWDEFLKM